MSESEAIHFGMKKLALENWREADVPRSFPGLTEDVWLSSAMGPQLLDEVPEPVKKLFEVARGSILYGWFFYPLLTLASEQLYRVQETAVRERCTREGIPLTVPTKKGTRERNFESLLRELNARGIIPQDEFSGWDAARRLRNWASHPKDQAIIPPGHALAGIDSAARRINQLFSSNPDYFSRLGLHVQKATGFSDRARAWPVVVGVDVGAPNNGFHLVALQGSMLKDFTETTDPGEAARWCQNIGAKLVAVDAPSGWRSLGYRKCREAEEMLSHMGYSSYPTATKEAATANESYTWMLNGERLYAALAEDYPLFRGKEITGPFCVETYPYLASCALAGRRLRADDKIIDRRNIVRAAGVHDQKLGNIHYLDAAICALVACSVHIGYWAIYGNAEEGYIVSPPYH